MTKPSALALMKVVRCSSSCPEPAIDNGTDPEPAGSDGEPGASVPRSKLAEYITTRDLSCLRFREGMAPVFFHIKRLPESWLAEVLDTVHPLAAQRRAAFRAAVHHIEAESDRGPLKVTPHKSREKGSIYVAQPASFGVEMAPSDFMQDVVDLFGAEVVQEMGSVAIDHARLARGARGPFSLWDGTVVTA